MLSDLDLPDKHTILLVDDTPDNLTLMNGLLRDLYKVKVAPSGPKALQILDSGPAPDLILLDIMMPEMDGFEVLRRLRAGMTTREIPVIFLTAMDATQDEAKGLGLGAVDYITKPISPAIVLARVHNHLQLKVARDFLKHQSIYLEHEIEKRTREILAVQEVTIRTMAALAETRDNETGHHIRRTQHYVRALAQHLQGHPHFRNALDDATIDAIYKSAPLHDIGKVGIPDHILLKPGKLTAAEFAAMKRHTTLGRDAIRQAEDELGKTMPFLQHAKEIAFCHHERWDGTGYPQGLIGNTIPVSARLMAVADVYDALISRRVYKPAFSHDQARDLIVEGRGSHFDPDIVDAFLEIEDDFRTIAARFADGEDDLQAQMERIMAQGDVEHISLGSSAA